MPEKDSRPLYLRAWHAALLRAILLFVMRRMRCPFIERAAAIGTLLGVLAGSLGMGERAFALKEEDIQKAAEKAAQAVDDDWNAALGYTCGGLLSATDERVLMAYERRADLDCGLPSFPTTAPPSPSEWCALFDEKTGACIGKKCELIRKRGVPDRTVLSECTAAGSCTPKVPHESCKFSYHQSRKRIYDCKGGVRAECYSYFPDLRYSQSYYPFAYNCLLTDVPAPPPDEPRGQPQLIPPYASQLLKRRGGKQWEPTPGSNVTVLETEGATKDGSDSALELDDAVLHGNPQVTHPTVPIATRLADYPDLTAFIGELADPPQVRLVLPSGGLGLRHPSALFERIFSSLRREVPQSTVTVILGNDPEALTFAARYLEDIPLFEMRYIPVKVQAPFASEFNLYVLAKEWETWIAEAEQMGNSLNPAVPLDGAVKSRIQNDVIKVLESYGALQNSIREYRLHFPRYMHALLGNIESANKFFSEQWLAVNATRLEAWAIAYKKYLPDLLKKRLPALQAKAAEYTAKCLVPACRLDTVPVLPGTKPWDFLPEDMELPLDGSNAAFLPEGPPAWANMEGRVVQWHPQRVIGTPLPDLTLDFSEILQARAIEVPVLEVEWLPLALPHPPTLDPESLQGTFASLGENLRPLPRLAPPLMALTFPTLRIPDPRTSLFLVPEPPLAALQTLTNALEWREKRLKQLQDTCDTAASPANFLAHEFQLYGSRSNPAALRAATFIPGEAPQVGASSYGYFLGALYGGGLPGGVRLPPLVAPPPCSDCGTVRPQRYLRQHAQMEQSFSLLQDHLLRAVDEWNAQVKFVSVVPRGELESVDARRPKPEDLFSSPE